MDGNAQTEVVTGVDSGTVNTKKIFRTLRKLNRAASTGTITIGTAVQINLVMDNSYPLQAPEMMIKLSFSWWFRSPWQRNLEIIDGTNVGEAIGQKIFGEIL